jgi:hypothetical protein
MQRHAQGWEYAALITGGLDPTRPGLSRRLSFSRAELVSSARSDPAGTHSLLFTCRPPTHCIRPKNNYLLRISAYKPHRSGWRANLLRAGELLIVRRRPNIFDLGLMELT